MTPGTDVDRIRRRWREQHRRLGLPDPSGDSDVSSAGLARRVDELSTRIVILPSDPLATVLEFDEEFWDWWTQERRAPFGARLDWNKNVPTVGAAVRARGSRDRWKTFVGLHRHGGIEIGTADSYSLNADRRCFRLIRTVGLLWLAFDIQSEVLRTATIAPPWEVTLALYGTEGAHLGNVGQGWLRPGSLSWDAPTCWEPSVVVREELQRWPEESEDIQQLAFRFGGRIEDAWGIRQRRFLNRSGQLEGQFDARHWEL